MTRTPSSTTGLSTLAIMQPYLFPYIGYFQLIHAVEKFVIYDDVNFIKRGWIHRNNILINGQANMFSVPLSKPSQNSLINEVKLGDWQPWASKFLKTLKQNYKKAPHFEAVNEVVSQVFLTECTLICELALRSLKSVCKYLEIPTVFVDSSSSYANGELNAQHRILDICRRENTQHYINPAGGRTLYDKELFAQNGILLNFIVSEQIIYPQYEHEFSPWLSIIDVLMFNDVETTQKLLTKYTLS